MKNTRLLFVIWMLFLVLPQGYSQGKKEDSSVLGQVNGFLSKHVKLTAYGQFGYSYTDRKDLDVSQADNQFFGRLGMLILSGDITDKLSWMNCLLHSCWNSMLVTNRILFFRSR
jgi:hypothetical protein